MDRSLAASMLGRIGGQVRGQRLSTAEKTRIASLGGKARRQSLQAARRIIANCRYAAAVAELRGRRTPIAHVRTCAGPLPGIYRPGS